MEEIEEGVEIEKEVEEEEVEEEEEEDDESVEEEEDEEEEDDDEEGSVALECCRKSCPANFCALLSELCSLGSADQAILFNYFLRGLDYDTTCFCWSHFRFWVGKTLNLRTSVKRDELLRRVSQIPRAFRDLQPFCDHPDHSSWFRKASRTLTDIHLLEPFLYHPIQCPPFTFDTRQVITRLAGSTVVAGGRAYEAWVEDGNLILPGFLSHLDNPRVTAAMTMEFDLYRHHFQPHLTMKTMGFRRNMYYSLTQQLIRQDPAWYALNASCRPIPHWRLVTYPYVAKDSEVDESLGFLHMDVNIRDFIESGLGANQLTSSVSLDPETPEGCTILVPGFYRHAREWYDRLKARKSLPKGGAATNARQLYRPEDAVSFGQPMQVPCKLGDVRITRPETIHGATSGVSSRRRVLFPWHPAVQDDHETLELDTQHTWSELAICHLQMIAPTRGVGGNAVSHPRPTTRFPPAVQMPSTSALCDALICRRPWTDPQVLEERDIVLGSDDSAALEYIRRTRAMLLKNYLSGIESLKRYERLLYGENSFFQSG